MRLLQESKSYVRRQQKEKVMMMMNAAGEKNEKRGVTASSTVIATSIGRTVLAPRVQRILTRKCSKLKSKTPKKGVESVRLFDFFRHKKKIGATHSTQ
jgi:hypothetical protein